MITAIITGGIATGKSSFTRHLAALIASAGHRAHVYSADAAVHELYARADVLQAICVAVGLSYPRADGERPAELRATIRAVITVNIDAKTRLEDVLHPLAFAEMQRRRTEAEAQGADVFLAEVPLYYESRRRCSAECVIVVAASRETQLRRMMSARGLDRETSERLLGIQFPLEDKAAQADKVVWNDGSESFAHCQATILLRHLLPRSL